MQVAFITDARVGNLRLGKIEPILFGAIDFGLRRENLETNGILIIRKLHIFAKLAATLFFRPFCQGFRGRASRAYRSEEIRDIQRRL